MADELAEIYLVRHSETAWSAAARHTGRTDAPLTPKGQQDARELGRRLRGIPFDRVLTSPLLRARDTCTLAGFGDRAEIEPDLAEVDYGRYEGLTTEEVRRQQPEWDLFVDGSPEGESVAAIAERVDRLIARLKTVEHRKLLLFAHKHLLQFLAARWICLAPAEARRFVMGAPAVSILGYYHALDEPVIRLWNDERLMLDR
jgi:probable phosphoglycerate mutase